MFKITTTALCTAVLLSGVSCVRSQPLPETKAAIINPNAPTLETEVVSTPVRSARSWSTAIAPNARGGWNFITQLYEYQSGHKAEVPTDCHTLQVLKWLPFVNNDGDAIEADWAPRFKLRHEQINERYGVRDGIISEYFQ